MQRINVQTAQNVKIAYEVASVGDRIIAFFIDIIIIGLVFMGITTLLENAGLNMPASAVIILSVPFMMYHLIFELAFQGQSLGKMALKLKVVMLDGSRPSIGSYIVRWLFRLIEITGTTGMVAVITILVNGKGQRIGDIAAGTTVVKLQQSIRVQRHELIKRESKDHSVTFDNVVNLTDADITIILESLKVHRKSGNKGPIEAAEMKTKEILEIQSDLPTVKFLYTIVKDYNYLTSGTS